MAVAFVASSQTGTSDAFVTSLAVPVPTGAAANHIAVVAIEQWEGGNPTVTPPSGFTALTPVVSGNQKLKLFWKRLTGSDTGDYTFTWTGSQWSMGHCVLISGGVTTGDPVEAVNTATATSTSVPSTTASSTDEPFLGHFIANENAASSTPPTNYTETRDGDYLKSNYRIPATTGSHTASGGTLSTSTLMLVELVIIKPDLGGGGSQTVVCNLLSTSTSVFNPAVVQIVAPLVISAPTSLFSPAVSPGSVSIQVPLISAPSTVFNPLVVSSAIIPTFLEVPSTLFEPSVVILLQHISMMLLQASSTVYAPTITGGGAVEVAESISNIARTNMLVDRGLTEPQSLSNVDLMRLVLADGAQTLVTETEATAAVHLWQYLRLVRDS